MSFETFSVMVWYGSRMVEIWRAGVGALGHIWAKTTLCCQTLTPTHYHVCSSFLSNPCSGRRSHTPNLKAPLFRFICHTPPCHLRFLAFGHTHLLFQPFKHRTYAIKMTSLAELRLCVGVCVCVGRRGTGGGDSRIMDRGLAARLIRTISD